MMSSQLKIYCTNIKDYIEIRGGETLLEIYEKISDKIDFKPICASVNYKTEDLSYQVFYPKQIEFLSISSESGRRTYIRSLCMVLYKAVHDLYPGTRLRIEHSISRGYFCRLSNGPSVDEETASALKSKMESIVKDNLPFERKERLTRHVTDLFEQEGLNDKVKLLNSLHELYTVYYKLGDVCDSYYGPLATTTGMVKTFDLQVYKDGLLLLGPDKDNIEIPMKPLCQEKMYRAFTDYLKFNEIVGVENVGELNDEAGNRDGAMVINVSEALHSKKIATISDDITERYNQGGARVVFIAGPSSSGKTTFTKRLGIQLMTNLLEPRMISLDDYFVDRHKTPLDEKGDYDYESLYALDLAQFNRDLNDLLAYKEVELPYYNFTTGSREYHGNKIKLNDKSILLIEGIHGLNPELSSGIDVKMKYCVYVSALTTISIDDHNWIPTTDNRLLRRIIRDYKYRGASATDTIRRWPSVRKGEEKWIFPYQENADSTFNSSLLFELAVIKSDAENALRSVPHDVPEYGEANRLMKFLSYFNPISAEFVPSTSLIREFLGGSSFKY